VAQVKEMIHEFQVMHVCMYSWVLH
jgi:hypothetical protein